MNLLNPETNSNIKQSPNLVSTPEDFYNLYIIIIVLLYVFSIAVCTGFPCWYEISKDDEEKEEFITILFYTINSLFLFIAIAIGLHGYIYRFALYPQKNYPPSTTWFLVLCPILIIFLVIATILISEKLLFYNFIQAIK